MYVSHPSVSLIINEHTITDDAGMLNSAAGRYNAKISRISDFDHAVIGVDILDTGVAFSTGIPLASVSHHHLVAHIRTV